MALHAIAGHDLNRIVAAEIRAELARQGMTQAQLAKRMGRPAVWMTRRLSPRSHQAVTISLDELEDFATALGVPWWRMLPRLDSNQQPFGNRSRDTPHARTRRHLRLVA